ncbi:hypothetical protein DFJ43DRAFT_1005892, partial [Lentinula guzmanii]
MTKWVAVDVVFPENCKTLFIEKLLTSNRNEEDIYGAPDTIIQLSTSPQIPVANFSEQAITISKGQLLGNGHNAERWLDQTGRIPKEDQRRFESQAQVLKAIAEMNEKEEKHSALIKSQTDLNKKSRSDQEIPGEEYGEPPVEGGPKTAEVVEDLVSSKRLLEEVDICKELSADQVDALQQILIRNEEAFGLDGRLGNYPEEVEIPMLPNAKPIALPPIPLSPVNREVV